jgi:hypothetical protein
MKYYVLMPDGQRFGPADVDMLTRWAHENLLNQRSMLVEESSGDTVVAGEIPGIVFPLVSVELPSGTQFAKPPTLNSTPEMPQANSQVGSTEVLVGWIMFGLSLLGLSCIGSIVGTIYSRKAMKLGNPNGQAPYIANIVVLVLWVVIIACVLRYFGPFMVGPHRVKNSFSGPVGRFIR